MRIVYDHGMGAMVNGTRPATGRGRDAVMIIHTGQSAEKRRLENGLPPETRNSDSPINEAAGIVDGIRIAGTGLVMRSSEEADLRDAEVRAHERSHLMALGTNAASGINLILRRGPDGRSFAVGGSVKVDTSPVPGDPEATIRKATGIINAALAPGDPSAADMRVAARAYQMASAAKQEIRQTDLFA